MHLLLRRLGMYLSLLTKLAGLGDLIQIKLMQLCRIVLPYQIVTLNIIFNCITSK